MTIFVVYEEESCKCCLEHCYNNRITHFCKNYNVAKKYLDQWIREHPKCVTDEPAVGGISNAICYYDTDLCADYELEPVTEDVYLKNNDYGGYRTCYIIKKSVEED